MAVLGKLVMSATLDYDKVVKGTKHINKSMSGVEKKMSAINGKMKAAFSVGAVMAFGAKLKSTFEDLDKIGKMSGQLGIAAEDLQKLRFAGEQTGVSVATMDDSLAKFTKRLGEAQEKGTGPLSDALDSLGITLKNTDGTAKTSMEVMMEYGDAMAKAQDPATKMFLATEAFGRSGGGLINTFAGGSKAVKELGEQLEKSGGVIGGSAVDDAERANDAMNLLSKSWGGASTSIMVKLAPAIESLAGWLTTLPEKYEAAIRWTTDLIETIVSIPEKIREGLADASKAVTETVDDVKEGVKDMASGVADMATSAVDNVSDMVGDIGDELGSKFGGIVDGATSMLDDLDFAFFSLENNVTKNSYMPDMVDAIAYHFGRLSRVMVKPSREATEEVDEAFSDLEESIKGSFEGLFSDIFNGDGVDAFKNFAKDVMGIFTDLISEMASKWVSSKIFGGGMSGGMSGAAESFIGKGGIGKFINGGSVGGGGGLGGLGGIGGGLGKLGTSISKSLMNGFKGLKGLFSGGGSYAPVGGMAGSGGGAGFSMAGAAIPLAIGAFGMARFAKSKQQKQDANAQYQGMGGGVNEAINQVSAFKGQLNGGEVGEFFITLNEGWTSTIQSLKEANLITAAQGALYDENGNQLIKMTGNVNKVKEALAGAAITGHSLGSSFAEANSSSGEMKISVVGDFEAIKTSIQAAGAIGVGTFKDIQQTANGASVSVQGDLRKWKTYLDGAIGVAISNMNSGLGGTVNQADALTHAFKNAAVAARSIPNTGADSSGMRGFASGGISHRAAIFGEAGPEAAVPLPDGRTIPVTISGGGSDNTETNMLLKKLIRATERASLVTEGYNRK